ncbi:MAG TPA: DUF885 domain-containing protein, partial [Vicinamibacteria bacterium]|nr:DUF885 domain-containing protein [Vicinamibacteria bacterium]
YTMEESPEFATYAGWPGHDHRWTDFSLAAVERRNRELEIPERVLDTIDRAALPAEDQLHFDLFRRGIREGLEGRRFKGEYLPLTQMQGPQQDVVRFLMLAASGATQAGAFENMLARLEAVPVLLEQVTELMRRGLDTGITPPRITLRDVPAQIESQAPAHPAQSPLLRAFDRFPEGMPEAEQDRLRRQAARLYEAKAAPAFRALHRFFVEEYLPGARESIALREVPDGEAWYAFLVRQSTTTTLTPGEIHAIGLREVARIRAAMDEVVAASGFQGGYAQFVEFLRHDPRFFFESGQDLLAAYRDITKRADPELVRLFGRLPRLPYGVRPVPAHAEKSQTTAYYEPGSPEAGRPGYFYANTYDLHARPRWEMEPLALHEAVPGHHLQIALAQELPAMPEFRKHGFYTAYVEGWGLYAESLGAEMGFYQDPYSRFGQLTYEVWRAIRLVVDTGIHALGWSRQQAIDYFTANAGKAEHDIVVEVDRYIVWPAQALAYKIGELKLKELRAACRQALGAGFDLRAFHDEVLGQGALPLDVLEDRIRGWWEARAGVQSPA